MPIKDIMNGVNFCGLLGTVVLCIVLVVSGILRWIKPADTRNKRLNISAWIAFAILCTMALTWCLINSAQYGVDTAVANLVPALIEFSKNVIWLMMFAAVIVAVMALLLVIILAVCKGLYIIIRRNAKPTGKKAKLGQETGKGAESDKIDKPKQETEESNVPDKSNGPEEETKKGSPSSNVIKEPIVILAISWGILALFLLIPFMVGERAGGSMIENWHTGLTEVGNLLGSSETAFVTYTLVYIAVMGIGFAVIKILYSLIAHTFEIGQGQSILDEYSSPIALLSVGVALLWTFRKNNFSKLDRSKIILELGKSFLTVVIIATFFILTLEVIRLLIDIRGTLIRKEAKYLFIALAGHVTIFFLGILLSICGALNNAIGSVPGEAMDVVEEKLRLKMVEALEKQMEASGSILGDDPEDRFEEAPQNTLEDIPEKVQPQHTAVGRKKGWRKPQTAFRAFDKKMTRK